MTMYNHPGVNHAQGRLTIPLLVLWEKKEVFIEDWMSRGDLPRPLYRFPKAHPQEHQTGEKSPRLILVRFWCPWGGDCCHDCPTIRTNRLAEIVIDVPFASRYNDDYSRERILTSRRHVLVDTTTTFEHSRMLRRKIFLA